MGQDGCMHAAAAGAAAVLHSLWCQRQREWGVGGLPRRGRVCGAAQVLDARDPLGCRCPEVETYIRSISPNKKIILLLNKMGACARGGRVGLRLPWRACAALSTNGPWRARAASPATRLG